MNLLDYIIIGIFLFYILRGFIKGYVKTIHSFVGTCLSLLCAKLVYPFIANSVLTLNLHDYIHDRLWTTFSRIIPSLPNSFNVATFPSSYLELTNTNPFLKDLFAKFPQLVKLIEENIETLYGQNIMDTLSTYVLNTFIIVFMFLIFKSCFMAISSVIISRKEFSKLTFSNRFLGLLINGFLCVIVISFALQIIEVYALISSPILEETITSSKYGHFFIELPILKIINNFIAIKL